MQSVPITTKVMSSNPAHGEVYVIQHYVIKFLSDRSMIFFEYSVSSTNKSDPQDITEILLKVALNTTTLTPSFFSHVVLSIIMKYIIL